MAYHDISKNKNSEDRQEIEKDGPPYESSLVFTNRTQT